MTVKDQRKPLKRGSFTEPGLLKAAKWVRLEALSIFYQRNDFIIAVTMKDFSSAYRWMLNIAASCATKSFGLSYFYVKGVNWGDIGKCIGLAKMIHELDLPVKANQASNRTGLAHLSTRRRRCVIKVGSNREHIKAALRRIEKLGFKAKAAGWSHQMLEQEFRALLRKLGQKNKRRTGFVLCGS